MQFDPQLRRGISSWGLQNLEVLVLEWNRVRYYPLLPRVARMFLIPQISSNIGKISNTRLWDVILSERYEHLSTMIYKSLHAYLAKDNSAKDPEVIYDSLSIQPVIDLITLYYEIIRFLSKEEGMKVGYVNVRQLAVIVPQRRWHRMIIWYFDYWS